MVLILTFHFAALACAPVSGSWRDRVVAQGWSNNGNLANEIQRCCFNIKVSRFSCLQIYYTSLNYFQWFLRTLPRGQGKVWWPCRHQSSSCWTQGCYDLHQHDQQTCSECPGKARIEEAQDLWGLSALKGWFAVWTLESIYRLCFEIVVSVYILVLYLIWLMNTLNNILSLLPLMLEIGQ